MKRIALFLMTNLAIIFVLSITLRLLGVERILDEQGAGLDLNNLLVFTTPWISVSVIMSPLATWLIS